MKKTIAYIILILVAIAAIVLIFTGGNSNEKQFNDNISLRKHDKNPYGSFVAYESLKDLFPAATIRTERKEPWSWDSLSLFEEGQAWIVVSPRFYADENDMKRILNFITQGNDVLISTTVLTEDVKNLLRCNVSYFDIDEMFSGRRDNLDSLTVSLSNPPFGFSYNYSYPGYRFDSYFFKIDTTTTTVLGSGHAGNPNFIHLKAGKGNLYVHLAPLAFSNYFLLHRKNAEYYESVMSVLSPGVKKIVWDEYYLNKRYFFEQDKNKKPGWFSALMGYKSLKWALLTTMLLLLLYVLFEMGRKQRYIPVVTKPRNDSLEFVKTIGRLYYDKADHKNLARKMTAYFMEHVRNKYKLPGGQLDEDWVRKLQFKTGYEEEKIQGIVTFIRQLDRPGAIRERELADFHKQLEAFYQKA